MTVKKIGWQPSSTELIHAPANDTLDGRFAVDVAVVCCCVVLALALGAVTLRRRTD